MAKWWFKAQYIETCNCAHGCPCNLTQIPTHGGCNAVVGWNIREGQCDGVDIGGLKLGYVGSWPGPIHKGNGHAVVIIDADTRLVVAPPARHRATRPTPMSGATPVCRCSVRGAPCSATAPTSTPA